MNMIDQKVFSGERALFKLCDAHVTNTIFEDGESPLKESSGVRVEKGIFKWKYPFWYSKAARINNSMMQDGARAGIWYADGVNISNTVIEAPKTFRRSANIRLHHVDMLNAAETFWMCDRVSMEHVSARGDYFAMSASNIKADDFRLSGNYSFDGCHNVEIRNARLLSKDAFWNCENITVSDSFISGEYIGWNSRNLTFINCTIESLQGFCYIDGLTLINCRLLNTTLAFEYCRNINIDVTTKIESIKNPCNGKICAADIGEIIFDDPHIDPADTMIIMRELKHAV